MTFFMALMFWGPHPGQPVPVFEDIAAAVTTAGPLFSLAIYGALAGGAGFAGLNLALLGWNLACTGAFLRSLPGQALSGGRGCRAGRGRPR